MTAVPTDSNMTPSPRIDYFSSLPNELLDDIFEQAYTDSPPSRPLSKRLLHWFEKHLYRKVSLDSSEQFNKFVAVITTRSSVGRHVLSLKLADKGTFQVGLKRLFHLLPNLLSLNIPCLPALFASAYAMLPSAPYLLRLERLATSILRDPESGAINLDCLAQLVILPGLKQLELYNWGLVDSTKIQRLATTLLPAIERLRIQGDAADFSTPLSLIKACPSLLHLELDSSFTRGPLQFHHVLPLLPFTLHSLSIHGSPSSHAGSRVDSLLPSFGQLRSLRLGDRTYSRHIHTILVQLPLLVRIHLGKGDIDPDGFLSLITGPSRLTFLRTITLDFDKGTEGHRIARPSSVEFDVVSELSRCKVNLLDWTLPGADDGVTFDQVGARRLIEAAEQSGILVKGSVFAALETLDSYGIELNNRSILFAFQTNDLSYVTRARSLAARIGVAPPDLDLDSLDITRLEIVEIDLPERDWFMLSLRNKE